MKLVIGPEVIASYKRLSYTPWHAVAEFVDNSTQSYFNNRKRLDAVYKKEKSGLSVEVTYDRGHGGLLRISDNAMGMSYRELENAMVVGRRPDDTSGRSQFGMGLKTSGCWIGDQWSVRTKKLGEPEEHEVHVDVQTFARGKGGFRYNSRKSKNPNAHYTIIEIRKHHREWLGRTLGKVRQFLMSFYRIDLREKTLNLEWQGDPLEWQDLDGRLLKAKDGSVYKRNFHFKVGRKKVDGWVGVLESGGRADAGFSILHRGRVVKGWPDSWRPESIYGQLLGSNDLVNQRLVGEVFLNDFDVSHTKDDIQWYGKEEEEVQRKLRKACEEYREVARNRRKGDDDERGPSKVEVDTAVDEFKKELKSPELFDSINLTEVPDPAALGELKRKIISAAELEAPVFEMKHRNVSVKGFFRKGSDRDPYVTQESTKKDTVIVVINTEHPHWNELAGDQGVLNYLRHCTYDALAEWRALAVTSALEPDTVKLFKDQLLRVPMSIEHHAAADRPRAGKAKSAKRPAKAMRGTAKKKVAGKR